MYAIKTRSGGVFLRMKAMNGAARRARPCALQALRREPHAPRSR
jgi:hypothetical protein